MIFPDNSTKKLAFNPKMINFHYFHHDSKKKKKKKCELNLGTLI